MLLWLLWSLELMLAYSKTAFTLGALKTYSPGTGVSARIFQVPKPDFGQGRVWTPEYKVVGTEMGATHTFSFSSEVVRCFSYRPITPYFAHNLNI